VRSMEEARVIVDEFVAELPTTCHAIAIGANKQVCMNKKILNQVSRLAACMRSHLHCLVGSSVVRLLSFWCATRLTRVQRVVARHLVRQSAALQHAECVHCTRLLQIWLE
jgi:hypothetical protein